MVAQLVERLLPIPEARASNPVIGKFYIEYSIEKTKIKKKRPGNGPLFKKKAWTPFCKKSKNH